MACKKCGGDNGYTYVNCLCGNCKTKIFRVVLAISIPLAFIAMLIGGLIGDIQYDYDIDKCKKLYNMITNLTSGQMQQVWRARGIHHTILILDGITKHRCLFEDYDDSFDSKDEDYDILERILVHMVKGWETSYDPIIMKKGLEVSNGN